MNDKKLDIAHYLMFAGLVLGCKFYVILEYGNATPFWDQWDAEAVGLYKPLPEHKLNIVSFFAPHNEHRIFTTRVLSVVLLVLNGYQWNPLLQMFVNASIHVLALTCLLVLLAHCFGRNFLSPLTIFSVIVFGIPYGWENTLAAFQSQFYFAILFSVVSLWLTVESTPLGRAWWCGITCSILAFFRWHPAFCARRSVLDWRS